MNTPRVRAFLRALARSRKTRAVTILAIVLLASALVGAAVQQRFGQQGGNPHWLSVRPESLDFGEVWSQAKFEWKLPLQNSSGNPTTIVRVVPACTCAAVDAAPLPLTIA